MFVITPLLETDHGLPLPFCIYGRNAKAESLTTLMHKIREVYLGRVAEFVSCEMYVLRSTYQRTVCPRRYLYEFSRDVSSYTFRDSRGSEPSPAVVREYHIPFPYRFDRPMSSIGHCYLRSGDETLI